MTLIGKLGILFGGIVIAAAVIVFFLRKNQK